MDHSVTIRIGGEVSVADFADRASLWAKVLKSLADEDGLPVRWEMADLNYSSAVLTAAPVVESEEAERHVGQLSKKYLRCAQELRAGRADPQNATQVLMSRLAERATADADITFETLDDEVTFTGAIEPPESSGPPFEIPATYGTVRGRIETLSRRRRLRFTLYDQLWDRAVSCYIQPGAEEELRNAWGRLADVTGLVTRDPRTDRPVSVRQVLSIEIVPTSKPLGFEAARGAVVPDPDSPPSEVIIRRARDAG